ncbi:acyl-CoA dehydrogenase family protein [Frigidibacter oleivorans]|uniref:acyl-CoA dehydrogenase family protein n=1 Tax=Frigidibacter oleivorans TaxID=2487129 RepID=UPI000F8C7C74|nr:acyl-CoA dehydrogenase [Frigidibacter oleivorans]
MDGAMQEDWVENARMIVDSARAIVPADGSLDRVRRLRAKGAGFERDVMAQAGALGLFLMRVGEEAGGLGLGLRETCELARVLGGGLVPEPILSTILAGRLLQGALPETVAAGEAVMLTAWQDAPRSLDWQGGLGGGRLSGRKVAIPGAEGADLFAVTTAAGVAVVPADAPGLTVTAEPTLDGGRLGTVAFDGVEAELLPCPDIGAAIGEAGLVHCAYLLGLSERALAITLDYLRVREQFGRPIGSFQALQHRATEMKIEVELARAAIFATARRLDTGTGGDAARRGIARCRLRASSSTMRVVREAIQMHGAMGITDEADIGLFVCKAMVETGFFGGAALQRRILSDLLDQGDAA